MSERKAVLFDMDGVIFDSERALRDCWLTLAAAEGLADMTRVYEKCIGVTEEVTGGVLCAAYGADFPWRDFRRRSTALYRERHSGGRLPLKPGARELLAALRQRGVPVALASSTRGEMVRLWLEEAGLLGFFDAIVSGDMVRRSKPDPEIFFKACAALGVKPANAFVIEDSFNGVRAAFAGGMHSIMVPDLLPPDDEMRAKAEAIFPTLREVGEYLLGAEGVLKQF